MPARLVPGYPIDFLPEERIVRHLSHSLSGPEGSDHLVLTDQRLVALSNHTLLWLIPVGISVESAFIRDVDLSGLAHRRLSFLLALFGAFLALAGMTGLSQSEEEGGGRGALIFMMLLGFGLLAAWLLIKRKYVVFTVSGTWHFSYRAIGGNSDLDIAGFLNAFALLKAGYEPGEQPPPPSPSQPIHLPPDGGPEMPPRRVRRDVFGQRTTQGEDEDSPPD